MKEFSYPIDYEMYTKEEIIFLVDFLSLIEQANETSINREVLRKKYNNFKKIVNSKSLEKNMDREFQKRSGYSIYKTLIKYGVLDGKGST